MHTISKKTWRQKPGSRASWLCRGYIFTDSTVWNHAVPHHRAHVEAIFKEARSYANKPQQGIRYRKPLEFYEDVQFKELRDLLGFFNAIENEDNVTTNLLLVEYIV